MRVANGTKVSDELRKDESDPVSPGIRSVPLARLKGILEH